MSSRGKNGGGGVWKNQPVKIVATTNLDKTQWDSLGETGP